MTATSPLIAFLCGAPNPPSRAHFETAAAQSGARTRWLDPRELGDPKQWPERPDVAVLRSGGFTDDIALDAVRRLEAAGVPCTPSSDAIWVVRDKLAAARALEAAGVPSPKFAEGCGRDDVVADTLGGYPVVVKARHGMRGEGIAMARNPRELLAACEQVGGAQVRPLLQRFVGDGTGEDVRVIVVGGRVLGAIRRTPVGGEFRANAHQGARVASEPVSDDLAAIAVAATAALNLDVAGVDLILHEAAWLVIEVNSSPGFEAFEAATGVDVASAVVAAALARAARTGGRS